LSLTKIIANLANSLIWGLTVFLPRWKRLTVRARLHSNFQPFEDVNVGEKKLKLFIPDRTCIFWAKEGPDCEPMTNAWINSFEDGETFVDIGANIGLYSLMAAAGGASRVFAIEANPFSFYVLTRNIITNEFQSIIMPICLAMNDGSSVATLKLGSLEAGGIGNEIVEGDLNPSSKSILAMAVSLDELVRRQKIPPINHLKIDVDGLELKILHGSVKLLADKSFKSILVEDGSEVKNGESEITSFLAQYDFKENHTLESDGLFNKIFTRK
jgi:FkbM family methyltransferase